MATYSHFNNIHINKDPSRPPGSMDAARSRTYHAAQVAQTQGVGGNASGMLPESGLGAYGNSTDNNLSTRPNQKGLDSRSVLTTVSMIPLPSAGGYSLSYVDHLGQLGHVEAAQPTMGHLLSATDAALGKFWAVSHSPETHLPIGCQVRALYHISIPILRVKYLVGIYSMHPFIVMSLFPVLTSASHLDILLGRRVRAAATR